MSFNQAELDELHTFADKVAARGTQVDSQIAGFIKGGTSALRDLAALVGLVKGAKMSGDEGAEKDDETEDEDPNTEDTGDNGMSKGAETGTEEGMEKGYGGEGVDKGDPSCGEGMEKGTEGAAGAVIDQPAAAAGDGYIDATDLVKGLEGRVVALQLELAEERKTTLALRDTVDAQTASIAQQNELIKGLDGAVSRLVDATATMGENFASTLTMMTKGISGSLDAMRTPVVEARVPDIHAAGQAGRFAGDRVPDDAPAGALSRAQLVKGLQNRLISDGQVQVYQRTLRFLNDDTENSKLIAQIAAL